MGASEPAGRTTWRTAALVVVALLGGVAWLLLRGTDVPAAAPVRPSDAPASTTPAVTERPSRVPRPTVEVAAPAPAPEKPPARTLRMLVVAADGGRPVEGALVRAVRRMFDDKLQRESTTDAAGAASFDESRGRFSLLVV